MRSFVTTVLFIMSLSAFAQEISYSPQFEEIRGTWMDDLIIMDNGKTALISISEDDGVDVTIYGTDHKILAHAKTENDKWTQRKLSAASMKGIYDINGDIVIFISQLNRGNMQFMHRLIISSETGKLIAAEKLGEIPTRRNYGNMTNESMRLNDYYVAVDEKSKNYAILAYEGYTDDYDDKIKVTLYDKTHKLVKTAVAGKEINKARFTQFAAMYMHNDDVYVCTNDYDPKSTSMRTPFYVSVLRHDANEMVSKKVDIFPYRNTSNTTLKFNPGNNMMQLITLTEISKDTKNSLSGRSTTNYVYGVTISFIDGETLQLISTKQYSNDLADVYAKKVLGDKEGYDGGLPYMVINHDNTTAMISEEGKSINGHEINDQIGITILDKNGREQEAYVMNIPEIAGNIYTAGTKGGVYRKYYFSTPSGNYILMNDLPENLEKEPKEKPHRMSTISDANTILCKLQDGKIQKSYLYGIPKEKRSAKFSKFFNLHYHKGLNTLALLMVDNAKGDKMSQIAWIKL
ncbi:MAG: hypothetical protein J0L80_07860 [Chitinophagales bacterium]|nr:hypothetical protein [Chitinophagales bacterium]